MKKLKDKSFSISPSPFLFSQLKIEKGFVLLLASLLVQLALMAYYACTQSLIIILATLMGAALAEVAFYKPFFAIFGQYRKFADGVAIISGLLAGFLLPSTISPVLAGVASFLALAVSRNFFNGKGNAWISASALAALFVFLSSPESFLTPSQPHYLSDDAPINASLFRAFGLALPESYFSLFFNPEAIVPAFKFNVVTIVSSIMLIALGVVDCIVPAFFLATYAGVVFLFSFIGGNALSSVSSSILFALFSNAVLFIAFYLLSDFSSVPKTFLGRVILGVLAGIVAFFTCSLRGDFVLGSIFTVFAANVLSSAIEHCENIVLKLYPVESVLHARNE